MSISNVRRVAVGISGGVDSAVAALLLKKKGYDVVGVFMKNWDLIDETGVCTVERDLSDAHEVCNIIKIPLFEANFVKEYWTQVFEELVNDYQNGLTPNPDINCNRNIKFNHFTKFAQEKLDTEFIATGHYARSLVCSNKPISCKLLKARDSRKDQTFFLSQVPQASLCRTLFPLGNLLKPEVKQIASENKLQKFARKKESMGICFIGQRDFKNFIIDYISPKPGYFIDIDSGQVVGEHLGQHNWTIGQRCRIGGCSKPYYIQQKTNSNDIIVAKGHDHLALFCDSLTTKEPFWVHSEPQVLKDSGVMKCQFRFQHREPLVDCVIYKLRAGLLVKLKSVVRAIAPGQYAVFYKGDECLGSARIHYPGPSLYSYQNMSVNLPKYVCS